VNRRRGVENVEMMSKRGVDPSSGISLGDVLRLPKRHPACRRREAQSGSWTERENLAGDPKTSAARRGASVFKMRDVSRHKSMDVLQAYVRDADLFRDHAGTGLL
jgi:hypothetical protein